jgi:hypothetical protein
MQVVRSTRALFAGIAAIYVVALSLFLPPPFGTVDTAFFKEAGANLAMGHGFTSAFAFGNPTAEPKLYAGYPPGLPLAFAGVAAVLGVSAEINAFFELALEAIVVLLAYALLSRAFREASACEVWCLFAVMLLALPARYILSHVDRPDPLGLIFALLALMPGVRTSRASWASALIAGLALVTSFIGGVLAIAGVGLCWILERAERRTPLWQMAGIGLLGSMLPLGLAVLILGSFDPNYPARLFGFLQTNTAPVLSAAGGTFERWWQEFSKQSHTLHYWLEYAKPSILLCVSSLLLWLAGRDLPKPKLALALLLLWTTVVFSIAVVPWNKLYGGLATGVILPALAVGLPAEFWRRRLSRQILLVALLSLALLRLPFEAYSRIAQASLGPSLERMEAALERERFEDSTGDGQIWIAVDPQAYFLIKPLGHRIFATNFWLVQPQDFVHLLDYVVMGYGPGGGPETPRRPLWWPEVEEEFELLYRPELPQFVTFFGFRLSNSSYSWETEIWQRR